MLSAKPVVISTVTLPTGATPIHSWSPWPASRLRAATDRVEGLRGESDGRRWTFGWSGPAKAEGEATALQRKPREESRMDGQRVTGRCGRGLLWCTLGAMLALNPDTASADLCTGIGTPLRVPAAKCGDLQRLAKPNSALSLYDRHELR